MEWLTRIADGLGRLTARGVPSAFAIAVLLTFMTFVLALTVGGATVPVVLRGWGDGFWELLTFSMQMAVVMFTGYLLALSKPVRRVLEWVASFARSPRSAVALMAFASMALAYLNWGLSIVASAMLVRFVAKKEPRVDYRLLVACAYFGLGATWHAGLSASAPLLVATPKHFLESSLGLVPIDRTLFSPFNLGLVVVVVAGLTLFAYLIHPRPEKTLTVDPTLLESLDRPALPNEPPQPSVAGFLDGSPWLNWLFGAAGVAWVLLYSPLASGGWKQLNINTVNFVFLTLAVLLHRTPSALLRASEEAASVLHGIVLQFPLYAGIYGVFKATGLTERIGEVFVSLCTQQSFPAVVYWYSGLVNYFVPSGGSKWAIEAPYLLKAAADLHVAPEKVVLAYAWGDMATDLVQPFWALPLLAVAKVEFKEILGYLLLACLLYVPLVSVAFWFLL